jgi:hypothetical protein
MGLGLGGVGNVDHAIEETPVHGEPASNELL